MRVIFKQDLRNPIATLQLFFSGGAVINETEKTAGLASFTHNLLLKGTTSRNAERLADDIDSMGASISADIDYDFADIGISAMNTYFDKSAELLSEIVFHPAFDEKEVIKERGITLAGIKSRQDSIFNTASDRFNKLFYGTHPYSWDESGTMETVSKFKREDVVRWHKDHYSPGQMLLVIIGNIELAGAKITAEKYFGGVVDTQNLAAPLPQATVPSSKKEEIKSKKFQQAYLMLGYPAPKVGTDDYSTLKIINYLLGSRMSGRLFTELREKLSLGYEVNCFYPSRRQLSRFVIYLGLEKKNLGLAKKRTREILEDLKKNPVSEQELQDTRNYVSGMYLMDHQTISRQAWYLGWWEIMGMGYNYDEKYLGDLMKVSAADVQKAAQKHFNDSYVEVEIVPSGGK